MTRVETRQLLSYSQYLQLTGLVYNATPREVTFHDDHSVKTKTTRQCLDVYAIELETISEPSRKAQETFRRQTQS